MHEDKHNLKISTLTDYRKLILTQIDLSVARANSHISKAAL